MLRRGRVARQHEELPAAVERRMVRLAPAGRDQFQDMPVAVGPTGVHSIHGIRLAPGVVREGHIDASIGRIHRHVLRPVHGRGPQQVRGAPGLDQHVGLAFEAVGSGQRPLAVHQRQPLHPTARIEARHVERALVQQVQVGLPLGGPIARRRDELVEVVEALIVAGVDHHAAVPIDDHRRALMLEAAQGGALAGHEGGIVGVDLHHPAKAVGLVGLARHVEARHVPVPAVAEAALAQAVARMVLALAARVGIFVEIAEIAVEVFLRDEHGAPGGLAAGTVVEGARNAGAGGVGAGTQSRVAAGGAGHLGEGAAGDAAVVAAVLHHGPSAGAVLPHFQDAVAVGGQFHLHLPGIEAVPPGAGPHQVGVGVLVVHAQQPVARLRTVVAKGQVGDEVVVVAELPGLPGRIEPVRLPRGSTALHAIAPAHQHLRVVAGCDLVVVADCVGQFGEAQRADGGTGLADAARPAQRRATGEQPLEGCAAAQAGGDDRLQGWRGRGIAGTIVGVHQGSGRRPVLCRFGHGSSQCREVRGREYTGHPAKHPEAAHCVGHP